MKGFSIPKGNNIWPKEENIYKAIELTPMDKVQVVILGQDPYPTAGNAHGLAFSVPKGVKVPASLKNIYKELGVERDSGDLTHWANQGVLLLNTILTVEEGKPLSHKGIGWEEYTLSIIKEINAIDRPIVFMLWGGNARKYKKHLDNKMHLVLESGHPSPLSANRGYWFGNNHFNLANKFIDKPIKW